MSENPKSQIVTVSEDAAGQRLDIFCVAHAPQYSRAAIQRAIKQGTITVNDSAVKPRYLVQTDDTVVLDIPATESSPILPVAEPLPIRILYADEHVVVINKPANLASHPGLGRETHTVASWFAERYPAVSEARPTGRPAAATVGEDSQRPGIVHRLDKDTTGVMILARNAAAYTHLKTQFQKRYAKKEYLALVFGTPKKTSGRIRRALKRSLHNPLRRTVDPTGKEAITEWRVEEDWESQPYTLLRLFPLTGRTHQLRAHLHWFGYPIVGDDLYTFKRQRPPRGVTHQLLHAEKLTIQLPVGKKKTFTAPLPDEFEQVLSEIRTPQAT